MMMKNMILIVELNTEKDGGLNDAIDMIFGRRRRGCYTSNLMILMH